MRFGRQGKGLLATQQSPSPRPSPRPAGRAALARWRSWTRRTWSGCSRPSTTPTPGTTRPPSSPKSPRRPRVSAPAAPPDPPLRRSTRRGWTGRCSDTESSCPAPNAAAAAALSSFSGVPDPSSAPGA
eukprot:7256630-Prymnesium_polylepis.1